LLEDDPTLTPDDLETALETSSVLVTDATNSLDFPRLQCTVSAPLPGLSPPAIGLLVLSLAGGAAWAYLSAGKQPSPRQSS
jgi:hypothetical protein